MLGEMIRQNPEQDKRLLPGSIDFDFFSFLESNGVETTVESERYMDHIGTEKRGYCKCPICGENASINQIGPVHIFSCENCESNADDIVAKFVDSKNLEAERAERIKVLQYEPPKMYESVELYDPDSPFNDKHFQSYEEFHGSDTGQHEHERDDSECAFEFSFGGSVDVKSEKELSSDPETDRGVKPLESSGVNNSLSTEENKAEGPPEYILDRRGNPTGCVKNLFTFIESTPGISGKIRKNQFTENIDINGDLPWKRDKSKPWGDSDLTHLRMMMDEVFSSEKKSDAADALEAYAEQNSYHPIKEYLEGLPEWDRKDRLDRLLCVYLGADDSPYVRAVTRKSFVACIARVYKPGCKFDTILTTAGAQGMGKSTLYSIMAGGFFSEMTMDKFASKEGMEKVAASWIIEIPELAGMGKRDSNEIKSFITIRSDKYRPSYGRYAVEHPRHCVFFASTNDSQFLRDATGNRRYWIVNCDKSRQQKSPLTDLEKERDQIWAEALYRYKEGEALFLDPELEKEAEKIQSAHYMEDPLESLIRDFLEMPLPDTWRDWSTPERQSYSYNKINLNSFSHPPLAGFCKRMRVCALEIWTDAMGKRREDMRPTDSRNINQILESRLGWKNVGVRDTVREYPKQRCYERPVEIQNPNQENNGQEGGDR